MEDVMFWKTCLEVLTTWKVYILEVNAWKLLCHGKVNA